MNNAMLLELSRIRDKAEAIPIPISREVFLELIDFLITFVNSRYGKDYNK